MVPECRARRHASGGNCYRIRMLQSRIRTMDAQTHPAAPDRANERSGGAVRGGASPPTGYAAVTAALHGPIVPTMLRLGLPTLVVLVVQTLVGVSETYFVSFLGTEALAGVSLVFPVLMLMQMMANGGFGGGVSAAVARALGAGRRRDADALVLNALVLALLL